MIFGAFCIQRFLRRCYCWGVVTASMATMATRGPLGRLAQQVQQVQLGLTVQTVLAVLMAQTGLMVKTAWASISPISMVPKCYCRPVITIRPVRASFLPL